jgi:hypothetical protein
MRATVNNYYIKKGNKKMEKVNAIAITTTNDALLKEFNKNNRQAGNISLSTSTGVTVNTNNIDISKVIVCGQTEENITIAECQQLMNLASHMDVNMLAYSAETELLFKLGTIMDKNVSYIINEKNKGIFAPLLSIGLTNDYSILTASVNSDDQVTKAPKPRKKRTPKAQTEELKVKKTEKMPTEHHIESKKVQSLTNEAPSNKTVSSTAHDNKTVSHVDVKEDNKEDRPSNNKADDTKDNKLGTNDKFSPEIIKIFLKRAGIRAAEMHDWTGTDEELAVNVMNVLKVYYDKEQVKDLFEAQYSKTDADYLMHWMGSNLVKLHETSCGNIE